MNRRELLKYTAVAMGIGSTSSVLLGALSGCEDSERPQKSDVDVQIGAQIGAQPRGLIAALAELIIPETDTPGAVAAGVPDFIDQIVSQWYTPTERKIFDDGLVAINAHCQGQYAQEFVDCTGQQQTQALTHFEEQASHYQPPPRDMFDRNDPEDTPFFSKI